MKAVVIILSILAFVGCMILGIQAANHPLSIPSQRPTNTPNLASATTQQRSIVVVLADDLGSPSPHLVGSWVVLYRRDLPRVSWVPLYPASPAVSSDQSAQLNKEFGLGSGGGPGKPFLEALKALQIKWYGIILTDEAGLARMVDWVDGIDLDGSPVTGSGMLASLVNPWDDLPGALQNQQELLQALCQKTAALDLDVDWSTLVKELMPRHLWTDTDLSLLIADWKDLVSGSSPIVCEFPQP